MKVFHPTQSPLSGTNLIEASAGTGKTYMIAWLFLRLLLETSIPAEKILVVTFTKAATEELKERIRNKLITAKAAFSKGYCDDVLIDSMVKHHPQPALAVHIIQDALINFDHVSIFTIHGFCRKLLLENAFETLSPFDTELVTNPLNFVRDVTDDFWRRHVADLPAELTAYVLQQISGPEYFMQLAAKKTSPDIRVIPELDQPCIRGLEAYRAVFEQLKKAWLSARRQVTSAAGGLKDRALSGTVYGSFAVVGEQTKVSKRDVVILSLTEEMDKFTDPSSIGFPLFKDFDKFTTTRLSSSTKKNSTPPAHDFFDICDQLYRQSTAIEADMEDYLLYLKTRFFKFFESEMAMKKKAANVQFFDDLLLKVNQVIDGKGNHAFTAAIRKKYSAALVDEFQDTDTLQYEIFTKLFASEPHILLLIGDPKQAIYGFRGADIFSYMTARDRANSTYTLIANWRSAPSLITAVNTIFSNAAKPFVFDQIRFDEGTPAPKTAPDQRQNDTALILWYLTGGKGGAKQKPMSKSAALPLIAEAVAGEIFRLIVAEKQHRQEAPRSGIKPGHIAVLVRTNRQAHIMRQRLSARKIPSVLYHSGNIFHTREALEMERILFSIAAPGNEQRWRTALVTDALGVVGRELDLDAREADWWNERWQNFRTYHRIWRRHGFIRMFRLFMAREKIKERLLSFADGERRLTNMLHLMELLHHASIEKKFGMTNLLKWFSEQRQIQVAESEAHLLRLESDQDAVKIITMHRSKGLEFPIVFCPFTWDGSVVNEKEFVFHDASADKSLTLDIGSSAKQRHLRHAQNERLAENLRLLYVALTRAVERCYLVWGRINTAETSAPAYLFHYPEHAKNTGGRENIIASLKNAVFGKTDQELFDDLKKLAQKSRGAIDVRPMPAADQMATIDPVEKQTSVSCRQFSGKINTDWKVSSYSYMVSKKPSTDEFPDRDQHIGDTWHAAEAVAGLETKADIFSFPRGVRAGLFFHDLFENLDFASRDLKHKNNLVENKLRAYGFGPQWQQPVTEMIQKVLSMPLKLDHGTLTLAAIERRERINEMEFYFPLNPISPQKLARVFHHHGRQNMSEFPEMIETLTFPLAKGFMKGYIDLVFRHRDRYYLIDWKSHVLGTQIQDYNQAVLTEVMEREYYVLQYHLYVLALHQYLRLRVPDYRYETGFGGVAYMFIRGIDPHRNHQFGVYTDLPHPALIHEMGKVLIPGYMAS
jgi:exodeoxyribonuclease V beta subunit